MIDLNEAVARFSYLEGPLFAMRGYNALSLAWPWGLCVAW